MAYFDESERKRAKAFRCEECVLSPKVSVDEIEDIAMANVVPLPYDVNI